MRLAPIAMASLLCLGIALVGQANADDDDDRKVTQKVLGKATIDLSKALSVAEARVPKGKALYAVTEIEDDKPLFEVFLLVGKSVTEVEVDVVTGEVSKVEENEDDEIDDLPEVKKALKASKITLAEAIATAIKKVKKGKPFEASVELDDGEPKMYVAFLVGEKVTEVEIDAVTGKVLAVDTEDD